MTIDKPITLAEDTHPRRPSMCEAIVRHWQCCVVWRKCAGNCAPVLVERSGGMTFTQAGEWESGSAQKIDIETAYAKLPWLHQRVIGVMVKHGPVDQQWGDPGYYRYGKAIKGFEGQTFDDHESFWRFYGPSLGSYHWSVLAETERDALERMARSLGWKPQNQQTA